MGNFASTWNNRYCAGIVLVLLGLQASAMDGVFDREAEIQQYLPIVQNGERHELIVAAKEIYYSGISDRRLAEALKQRLLRDYKSLDEPNRVRLFTAYSGRVIISYPGDGDGEYGMWMAHALGSFGIEEYAATLDEVAVRPKRGSPHVGRMRATSLREARKIDWHRRKNEVMASRANHHEGDDPKISRLINMLTSEDRTFRDFALDYAHDHHLQEPRLLNAVEQQVVQFIEQQANAADPAKDRLIVADIKLLGQSNDRKYAATLERVLTSNVEPVMKKHAQNALSQLK